MLLGVICCSVVIFNATYYDTKGKEAQNCIFMCPDFRGECWHTGSWVHNLEGTLGPLSWRWLLPIERSDDPWRHSCESSKHV